MFVGLNLLSSNLSQ